MRHGMLRLALLIAVTSVVATTPPALVAESEPVALSGLITSAEEGPMEGVLVSAKRTGGTISTTVITDAQGRYRFPRARLEPGAYALGIRAIGYDLSGPAAATIEAKQTATVDLKLEKTKDLAAQLTNAEWLASFPGTDQQRADVRGCAHCHSLSLVTRSRHTVDEFTAIVERMSGYPPLANPLMPQRTPAPRIGPGQVSRERQLQTWRRQAEYLATLNLSAGPHWSYSFKTLDRPRGDATRVIYTEYDLPKRTRQPHDVIVDSTGMAWYASFGEQILGKLDPKTGKVTEYEIPLLKPGAPTGILGMRFDRDENPWLAMQFQGGLAKFDRKTEKFQTWSLPADLNGPHVQINQVSPQRSHIDGKVWLQDAGTYTVLRLDVASGKFERFEPYPIPRPNVYDVIPDSMNNGYFLVMGAEDVGRIDAKSGKIDIFKTPTKGSGPRRGMMDPQDRLWFGENRSDKIGMFDTRTQTFQEWAPPTAGSWPYDVTADRQGEVWSGGEYNDRIARLNPRTGRFVEYLLPGHTNVRRVWVDNQTTPVTFWVGSNHAASIVKLEPLDGQAPATATAAGSMPDWAYAIPPLPPGGQPTTPAPVDATTQHRVPGSTLTFTRPQISNGFGPADWFPDDHPRMPEIVARGRQPDARACGLCHYPNGKGRQENAGVSGLPVSYFIQTLNDFRSGLRVSAESRKANTNAMIAIAKAMTPEEIRESAEYFGAMKWTPWIRVVESSTVPKMVSRGGIWIPVDDHSKEPIGNRVIETPEDPERTEILRDPRSGFVAYAPLGSLKKGEALVRTGGNGRTLACGACHGADLKGVGPVPGIAGRSPSYLARQMYDMQAGARRGEWTELMKPVVAKLTAEDLVSISAYVASLLPPPAAAGTQAQGR